MRRAVAVLGLAAVLAVAAGCSDDGSGSDDPTERDPVASEAGPRVDAFLDATEEPVASELCAFFTQEFLVRLARPDGDCRTAMATLTTITGRGEASVLPSKSVDEVVSDGDVAVVTLTDRVTGDDELPIRLRWDGTRWLLDEIGTGAATTADCIAEARAVRDAVTDYLEANTVYPADAAALVPSYLEAPPTGHEVADGEVVAVGDCAG